jgi:NADH-quinone oxidoreductase subunit L
LRRRLPLTHAAFAVAVLAIAGLPPFSGFFSKDEILRAALEGGHPLIHAVGLGVAVLTPFYMGRLYLLAFGGTARSEGASHAHEAPWTMTVPLVLLALLALSAGWLPMGEYIGLDSGLAHHGTHGIHWNIALPATGAAVLGLALAWLLYGSDPARGAARRESLFRALGPLGTAITARFWIDEIWLFVTHRIIFNLVAAPIAWFDRHVVDGGVNLTGWLTRTGGAALTQLQNGQVQAYATWITSGAAGLGLALYFLLR